ncbi:MAG TPA: FAD-dependent oxidoreductase, partial [Armatimonadota bacterium]|nr:FAD-dependent oxidoreductase [Armatimonadota bacterium]
AARAGADTLLVERCHYPGGVATAGLVCNCTNFFVTQSGNRAVRGLATRILDRLVAAGGAMPHYARPEQPQIPYDPETLKWILIEMLREAGVRSRYGLFVSRVTGTGSEIDAVVCEGKGGPVAFRARQFVDATGDLDLFALSDGPFDVLEGFSTLQFRMGGVDIDGIMDWLERNPDCYAAEKDVPTSLEDTLRNWREFGVFHLPHYGGMAISVVREAVERGELPDRFGEHVGDLWAMGMFASRRDQGRVLINSCACRGDELDPVRRSECEEESRLAAHRLAEFLRAHFPGFEQAYLAETAPEVATRFTRRLRGMYTLTRDEQSAGTVFPDCVGRITELDRRFSPCRRYAQAGEVPFGCLVSEAPANAICGSGKSASTEPRGLLRGQVGCMVVGEAAGTAAAVAARSNVPVRDVDVSRLQQALIAADAL